MRGIVRNNIFTIGLVLASLVLVGCGGSEPVGKREPVYPVSGTVTYKGQPVADADVTFLCQEKNMSSFARTDAKGKFKLTSYASFDGAPSGKQTITVSKLASAKSTTKEVDLNDPTYDPLKLVEDAKAPPPKNSIPEKYADAKTTDLFATVTADSQTPEVNLILQD
ncbi:hypothetical protein LBMAG52_21910 [Planctomycetia bacterium]|nr:hypothetical protein LBMAG52_21910 [Planctomycetia bacterium]